MKKNGLAYQNIVMLFYRDIEPNNDAFVTNIRGRGRFLNKKVMIQQKNVNNKRKQLLQFKKIIKFYSYIPYSTPL